MNRPLSDFYSGEGEGYRSWVNSKDYKVAMEKARWNLYRGDSISLLYRLANDIHKTGGERQRDEGLKLITRIIKRLREWVK